MKFLVLFLSVWMLLGAISFFWSIYKAPIEDDIHHEDWLFKNVLNI